jgi:hypothetical protein
VESVDLRFSREAVVNPETSLVAQRSTALKPAQTVAPTTARKSAGKSGNKAGHRNGKKHLVKKSV